MENITKSLNTPSNFGTLSGRGT